MGLHLQPLQQGGDLLAAAVDQNHPHPHGLEGGGVLQNGVGGGRVQGGAAVLDHNGAPLIPAQQREHIQQGPDFAHPIHAVLDIVLMEIFLGIVYVGRAVNILDASLLPGLGPLPVRRITVGTWQPITAWRTASPRSGTME